MFHGGDQQTLFYSGDNDAINLLKVTNGYEMKLSRFSYLSHTVRLFNAKPAEVCGKGDIYYQLAQTRHDEMISPLSTARVHNLLFQYWAWFNIFCYSKCLLA